MSIKKFKKFVNESKYEQDEELNRVLDKISSQGIESLTKSEKSYLDGEYEIGTEYDGTYDDSGFDGIDNDGKYIEANKENYLFKVYDNKEQSSYSSVGVVVLDKSGKYIIESHVSDEIFPELKDIGLEDLSEGVLEYYGKLSKEKLVEKLKEMRFSARLADKGEEFNY
jgi:hypothetical protein